MTAARDEFEKQKARRKRKLTSARFSIMTERRWRFFGTIALLKEKTSRALQNLLLDNDVRHHYNLSSFMKAL